MKNRFSFVIINIIAFAAILALCILFAPAYNAVFAASLIFTAVAFAVETAVNVSLFGNGGVKAYFFSLPAAYISGAYVVLQSAACIAFIFLFSSLRLSLAVQLVVMAAFCILLLAACMGRETLASNDRNRSRSYMTEAASRLGAIKANAADRALKAKITSLAEEARMSNPSTAEELYDIENRIDEKITALEGAVKKGAECGDVISEIGNLIKERNSLAKTVRR